MKLLSQVTAAYEEEAYKAMSLRLKHYAISSSGSSGNPMHVYFVSNVPLCRICWLVISKDREKRLNIHFKLKQANSAV